MKTTYLFAGGGTGGHLFPAVAIAEALADLVPGARCRFVCSTRPLDAEILSKETLGDATLDYRAIPAQPFGLRPRTLAGFLGSWGGAVRAARTVLKESPNAVIVAMGGFVAAPVVQAARAERRPVVLVNLDAVPGRANRWIARHARQALTSAPLAPGHQRASWETTPPIVRRAALAHGTPAECRGRLGLDPSRPTLLVTGASQGAGSINRFMIAFTSRHADALAGWQVIHQTGPTDADELRAAYAVAHVPAIVEPFFRGMGDCWGAADAAVSRAGAGSVAEAWAARVPTLFLPYPYHKDQHQRHNARPLEEAGGAVVSRDRVDALENLEHAGRVLVTLLTDAPRRDAMRAGLTALGPVDGAQRVAEVLAGYARPTV